MVLLFYLFVWQPQYIQTFVESPIGKWVFVIAIILEIIGVLWVVSLTRPEV